MQCNITHQQKLIIQCLKIYLVQVGHLVKRNKIRKVKTHQREIGQNYA